MDRLIKISILIILTTVVFSCRKTLSKTTETREQVSITYKDTTIVIPETKIIGSVINDSLLQVLLALKSRNVDPKIIIREANNPTNLTISLDSVGNVRADCQTDEQMIKLLLKELKITRETKQVKVISQMPNWAKYLIGALIIIILIMALLLISLNFIKNFNPY